MSSIKFFVPGIPKPAGSKRGFAIKKGGVFTGKVAVVDACKGSRDWKTDVKYEAKKHLQSMFLGAAETQERLFALYQEAISVTLTFTVQRPANHFRSGKFAGQLKESAPKFPTVKPDLLKLARGVEDALTGIVWRDDALIADEHLRKEYGIPGCLIEITTL